MQFSIPFIYQAEIVKKGDTAFTLVSVLDHLNISIEDHQEDSFHRAFTVGDVEYLWNGKSFIYGKGNDTHLCSIRVAELESLLSSVVFVHPLVEDDKLSPFLGDYHALNVAGMSSWDRYMKSIYLSKEAPPETKDKLDFTVWLRDSRSETIANLHSLANQCLLVNGTIHKTVNEPRYVVWTSAERKKKVFKPSRQVVRMCVDDDFAMTDSVAFSANNHDGLANYVTGLMGQRGYEMEYVETRHLHCDIRAHLSHRPSSDKIVIHEPRAVSVFKSAASEQA